MILGSPSASNGEDANDVDDDDADIPSRKQFLCIVEDTLVKDTEAENLPILQQSVGSEPMAELFALNISLMVKKVLQAATCVEVHHLEATWQGSEVATDLNPRALVGSARGLTNKEVGAMLEDAMFVETMTGNGATLSRKDHVFHHTDILEHVNHTIHDVSHHSTWGPMYAMPPTAMGPCPILFFFFYYSL
ncbi:uncharacterized protein LOC122074865 isoform X2 [Macadamia integrifolia]|uniref:uncharacterized protein LOC122074865 isoform X2 n=1 Tax=Macadamia integrifolia TaxID=60698 RepID=UPI001C4FCD52|nr:uncharacterized protein LOC122074865 isoform X2 [Macadamia integrifolia]